MINNQVLPRNSWTPDEISAFVDEHLELNFCRIFSGDMSKIIRTIEEKQQYGEQTHRVVGAILAIDSKNDIIEDLRSRFKSVTTEKLQLKTSFEALEKSIRENRIKTNVSVLGLTAATAALLVKSNQLSRSETKRGRSIARLLKVGACLTGMTAIVVAVK